MKNKILTVKISELLEARLNSMSRKTGQSRSEIVRRALQQYLSSGGQTASDSFRDSSLDLAGCVQGPSDLSWGKTHFVGYGE
jgi:hypothetical protein